jgi:hypothetical protein
MILHEVSCFLLLLDDHLDDVVYESHLTQALALATQRLDPLGAVLTQVIEDPMADAWGNRDGVDFDAADDLARVLTKAKRIIVHVLVSGWLLLAGEPSL